MGKVTLYVPKHKEALWRKLVELAEREDRGVLDLVLQHMEQYINTHYPGNPQRPLTVYLHQSGCQHDWKLLKPIRLKAGVKYRRQCSKCGKVYM